ncbi:hypothetical protein HYV82_03310 [Candidatus Woesearchaeota archaeon]|nr:hypothetical protein [Candidatus Woesearchaeota archaeon]
MPASQLQRILAIEALVLLTQAACVAPVVTAVQAARAAVAISGQAAGYITSGIARKTENPGQTLPQAEEELQSPPLQQEERPENHSPSNPPRILFAEMLLASALKADWHYNAIIGKKGPVEDDANGRPRTRLYYQTRKEFRSYNPDGIPLALEFRLEEREPAYAQLSMRLDPQGIMPPRIKLDYVVGHSDGKGNVVGVKQECIYERIGNPASEAMFRVIADVFEREAVANKAALELVIAHSAPFLSRCKNEPRVPLPAQPIQGYMAPTRIL